jgi:hypothetical protein
VIEMRRVWGRLCLLPICLGFDPEIYRAGLLFCCLLFQVPVIDSCEVPDRDMLRGVRWETCKTSAHSNDAVVNSSAVPFYICGQS